MNGNFIKSEVTNFHLFYFCTNYSSHSWRSFSCNWYKFYIFVNCNWVGTRWQ